MKLQCPENIKKTQPQNLNPTSTQASSSQAPRNQGWSNQQETIPQNFTKNASQSSRINILNSKKIQYLASRKWGDAGRTHIPKSTREIFFLENNLIELPLISKSAHCKADEGNRVPSPVSPALLQETKEETGSRKTRKGTRFFFFLATEIKLVRLDSTR